MNKESVERVREHLKTYQKMPHKHIIKASQDEQLTTPELIVLSREICVEEEKDDENTIFNFPIVILQERADEEVFNQSIQLLQSLDAIDKALGCRILKGFPDRDRTRTEFTPQIIEALAKLMEYEKEEDILSNAVYAITCQCDKEGHDLLLNKEIHLSNSEYIRHSWAYGLLYIFDEEYLVTKEYAEIFLLFLKDEDEDIRWSVLYDITEFPLLFKNFKQEFLEATENAFDDPFCKAADKAKEAYQALLGV